MPYLCCKMWRWKDLQVDAALHRLDPLPWCRFGRGNTLGIVITRNILNLSYNQQCDRLLLQSFPLWPMDKTYCQINFQFMKIY